MNALTDKRKFLFSCKGVLQKDKANQAILELIKLVGMTPARSARIDDYPFEGGGGEGYTGFFPLTESYIMVDMYSDLMETEILISTCKPERLVPYLVIVWLTKNIGPCEFKGTL